jgi:GAF domain-containing protein
MDEAGASPLAEARAMAVEALIAVRAGDWDQALRSGGAAVAFARAHTPHPPLMGLALVAQAEALLVSGRMGEAEAAAADALRLAQPEGHALKAHARLLLATAMRRRQPRESARLLEETLAGVLADETPNRLLAARAWRQLGEGRLVLNEPAAAIEALTRSLEEAERHGWPYVRVTAMIAIARYHKARRHYARMQRMLMAAVPLAQASGFAELLREARALSRFGVNGFTPLADLQRLLEHPGPTRDLVTQALTLARGLARMDRAAVYLWEQGEPRLAGAFPEGIDPLLSGHALLKQVLKTGKTLQRHGVTGMGPRGWLVDAEVRSLLAAPLSGPHGPLGVLYMDRRAAEEPFTRGEAARLEALAAYTALSLDRSQLRSLAGNAPPAGHTERLEAALSDMLEAEQAKRGYLSIVSADLRHQLGQLREAIATHAPDSAARPALLEAVEHAERLAEVLEKGIRE